MNRINIPRWNTTCAALFSCISFIDVNAYAQTSPSPLSPPSRLTAEATSHDTIELNWTGAKTDKVDIYRDDALLVGSQDNSGSYTNDINRKEGRSYLYKVCKAGSATCSNIAGVIF